MRWYEINRKSMEISKASLLKKLEEKMNLQLKSNIKLEHIESMETKDGNLAVHIRYQSSEYRLNSSYRPIEEARRWAEQFKLTDVNTIINMFGFGNGVFARELLNKMNEKDLLLIYEPCYDIFNHIIMNYDISDILLDKRVFIFINDINQEDFRRVSNALTDISNINSQIQCIYPNYNEIFTGECIKFFKDLKDSFTTQIINTNTLINFSETDIINTFKNMEFIKESSSINELRNAIPTDVPAILVAAGPSVEENINMLKKAKGRAVIFAVDRILDYLLDSGVEPDFVLTIDGKKSVEYFTKKSNVKIPLITYFEANYDILKIHNGMKVFCSHNIFIQNIYSFANHVPPNVIPSGSVALVGFTVCAELGFEKVILVGQDLAYDSEKSHAGNINEKSDGNRDVYIDSINGGKVKSRYDWREFVIRYADLMYEYSAVEVIDAKKKGAKIKGAIVMPLEEAIDRYCSKSFEPEKIINNIERTFTEQELRKIKEYLKKSIISLRQIKEKAKLAIKDCDILLVGVQSGKQTNKYHESIKRIMKTNTFIESQEIYAIIDAYVTAKSTKELSGINKLTEDIEENSRSTFEKSKSVYQHILSAVDFVYPNLEMAIEKI